MRLLFLTLSAVAVLAAADGKQLFNGKDLSGWRMVGPGRFIVEDGMLKTEGGMGLLYYTGQKFGDQTVHVVFKTATPNANSGVYIRMPEAPNDPWYGVHNGYEVQIDAGGDDWHCTGAIYSLSKVTKRTQKPGGEWNTMDIHLEGKKTIVFLNGEKVNEFAMDQPVPDRKQWFEPVRGPRAEFGYLGLQNHDGRSTIYFKEVSVSPDVPPGALKQGDRDHAMSYLHSTRKQFLDALAGISDAQWNYKPGPDRWSVAEVAEHLALAEDNLFHYAMSGLGQSGAAPAGSKIDDKQVIAMMTNRENKAQAPSDFQPTGRWKTRDDLVQHFLQSRDRNIKYLQTTPESLRSSLLQSPMGVIDVYQAMLMIPAHTERHLAQIKEVQSAAGYPRH
jgi:uncharacterized damage-inducible protein DinB